jgi:Fungal Zn(2)-Cys(6) binuclear cluster domain
MSALEDDREGSASAHGKPCVGCRKRKVKCDKNRPCSNCSRSKQLCTYENPDAGASLGIDSHAGMPTDSSILDRLARLEDLMATMLVRGDSASERQDEVERSPVTIPPASRNESANQVSRSQVPSSSPLAGMGSPVGQQIFQEGFSGYFDSEFWPGMITEVRIQLESFEL